VRYVSISKARRVLGYEPRVGLADGVKMACQVSGSDVDVGAIQGLCID
jgi:nucleoside-diphosphate-sugar epimerase